MKFQNFRLENLRAYFGIAHSTHSKNPLASKMSRLWNRKSPVIASCNQLATCYRFPLLMNWKFQIWLWIWPTWDFSNFRLPWILWLIRIQTGTVVFHNFGELSKWIGYPNWSFTSPNPTACCRLSSKTGRKFWSVHISIEGNLQYAQANSSLDETASTPARNLTSFKIDILKALWSHIWSQRNASQMPLARHEFGLQS